MPGVRLSRPTPERRSMLVVERGDKLVSLDQRLDDIEAQQVALDRKVDRAIVAFLVLGIIVNAPTGIASLISLGPSVLHLLGIP